MSVRRESAAESSVKAPHTGGSEHEERALVARVARQDRDAFEDLYRRYHPRLWRYLNRHFRAHEAIEDLIQEILLVVWKQAARFRGDSKVSSWIVGIAYRKALASMRRSASRPFAVPDEELEPVPESRGRPLAPEVRMSLRQAVRMLPVEQRMVVELTYFYGHSYGEIAGILGCPENTVKTRMFHARRKLREALSSRGD
ncbi:MAG TPA: sigma-70 family RNA polymerase sigma factor [Thermoanaerobaculia bacterium]|nr:sigma-70 family RNA polymerase sigma factor [Thermoanaerobaculia bacterium]